MKNRQHVRTDVGLVPLKANANNLACRFGEGLRGNRAQQGYEPVGKNAHASKRKTEFDKQRKRIGKQSIQIGKLTTRIQKQSQNKSRNTKSPREIVPLDSIPEVKNGMRSTEKPFVQCNTLRANQLTANTKHSQLAVKAASPKTNCTKQQNPFDL